MTPEEVATANDRLALYFAKPFVVALGDDAVQIARIALWRACQTHDPEKGALSTWAGKHIRYALIAEARLLRRHFPQALGSLDRPITNEEGSDTLGDLVADPKDSFAASVVTPVEELLARCSSVEREVIRLRWGIGEEQPSDPATTSRHGATRGALRTMEEVAAVLGGITRERVRQIEAKAQARMRGDIAPAKGEHRASKTTKALHIGKPSRGWLWSGELASLRQVPRRSIVRQLKDGRIKGGEYVGKRWRIPEEVVDSVA